MASSQCVIVFYFGSVFLSEVKMGLWRPLKSQVSHFILIALKVKLLVCIYLVVHVDIISYWFNGRQLGKAVPEVLFVTSDLTFQVC